MREDDAVEAALVAWCTQRGWEVVCFDDLSLVPRGLVYEARRGAEVVRYIAIQVALAVGDHEERHGSAAALVSGQTVARAPGRCEDAGMEYATDLRARVTEPHEIEGGERVIEVRLGTETTRLRPDAAGELAERLAQLALTAASRGRRS